MKITEKHLIFLAQKKHPTLASKVHGGVKVSIHDLIPKMKTAYKRERECEIHNTLNLLKNWRKTKSNNDLFHKLCKVTYTMTTKNWRNRLFTRLIKEHLSLYKARIKNKEI